MIPVTVVLAGILVPKTVSPTATLVASNTARVVAVPPVTSTVPVV